MSNEINHWHFTVIAAMGREGNTFTDSTSVDFQMPTPDWDSAIDRARKLCPGRIHIHVQSMIEHHDHRDTLSEAMVRAIEASNLG